MVDERTHFLGGKGFYCVRLLLWNGALLYSMGHSCIGQFICIQLAIIIPCVFILDSWVVECFMFLFSDQKGLDHSGDSNAFVLPIDHEGFKLVRHFVFPYHGLV